MIPTSITIALFFTMFIYSGFNKIHNYQKKLQGLDKHTGGILPDTVLHLGLTGVLLLEILGSIAIIAYFSGVKLPRIMIKTLLIMFLVFLVVVTVLYHPPTGKMIPFLSNVTTFSGLYLIFNMVNTK
tara:strand:+ start:3221 stop:3601 length:381 start_codon:yes stop_codon:yes gene_type:complete